MSGISVVYLGTFVPADVLKEPDEVAIAAPNNIHRYGAFIVRVCKTLASLVTFVTPFPTGERGIFRLTAEICPALNV
jgi:hypothetical protein